MKNIFRFFLAVFALLTVQHTAFAQTDGLVKVKALATPLNDSSYSLTYSIEIKEGWHIYGNTPATEAGGDPLTVTPKMVFALETLKPATEAVYSKKSVLQKDALFENAFVFDGSIQVTETFIIRGFQPDTLRGTLQLAIAKGNEFYQQEIPVALLPE